MNKIIFDNRAGDYVGYLSIVIRMVNDKCNRFIVRDWTHCVLDDSNFYIMCGGDKIKFMINKNYLISVEYVDVGGPTI